MKSNAWRGAWSVRELKRQIGSLYFERLLRSHVITEACRPVQADVPALDPKRSLAADRGAGSKTARCATIQSSRLPSGFGTR